MSGKKMTWLFGILALGGVALGAQEAKDLQPEGVRDVVTGDTVDVRVVNVDVLARDSEGRPVRGLKAADFRLLVDKKEVAIDYFTEVADGREVAGPEAGAPPAAVGTSYLIFIDDAYSIDGQRNRVLSRLEQDLKLGPEDRAAVVSYADRPALLASWTGDGQKVRDALDKAQSQPIRRVSQVWNPGVEGVATAAAMAMRSLPSPPGRKVLLLVSGGWPELVAHSELTAEEVSPFVSEVAREKLFEPVADTANLLGYTIYFLEVPGAYGGGFSLGEQDITQTASRKATLLDEQGVSYEGYGSLQYLGTDFGLHGKSSQKRPDRLALVELDRNLDPYQNLWRLARRTGGTAVLYAADRNALERVERDSGSHYSLAFSPRWRADGRRHRIEVEVRRRGVKVQSRDGYFDMTPRMQATLKSERMLLFGGGAAVQAAAGKARWAGLGAIHLPVTLSVPASMLTARPVSGGYELKANVSITSCDDWAYCQQHKDRTVALTLPKAPAPEELVPFKVTLSLSTLGQRISFVVLDDKGAGV
ncbi:MAG TPA: VWA domain-containing protein, partial [Thermoanaerobaculia bacterium]|nr:VWA domain-containing protein [Thermoanaerobaculia bacterium]